MKLKILRNSFLMFVLIYLISTFVISNISILNFEERYINVISNNDIVKLKLGSTFEDLSKFLNITNSNYSNNYILHNNEIINNEENTKNKISINKANITELCTLPGIGEKTALKIIKYRNEYGFFKNINELKEVSGIGDKKYEKIKEFITI